MTTAPSKPVNAALLAKYAMAPLPESIVRLSALVARRDADLTEVAKLIASDAGLTERLLEGDVPASGAIEEVERQIFRLGLEPILVLAMSEPLIRAVQRTFLTMADFALQAVDVGKPGPSDVRRFTCSLEINGRATGKVYLRMDYDLGCQLAAKVLRIDPAIVSQTDIIDVLAELSNMTVGTFQSNLCDAGLPCRLSVPTVAPDAVFAPPKVPQGRHRGYGFRHDGALLLTDLLVELAS